MLAIPMEPRCRDPKKWLGSVKAVLGSRLYVSNFAFALEEEEQFQANVDALAQEVIRLCKAAQSQ